MKIIESPFFHCKFALNIRKPDKKYAFVNFQDFVKLKVCPDPFKVSLDYFKGGLAPKIEQRTEDYQKSISSETSLISSLAHAMPLISVAGNNFRLFPSSGSNIDA